MAGTEQRRIVFTALAAGLGYAVFYLYAIGDVDFAGPPAWDLRLGALTAEHVLRARAPFQFEAIAVVEAGYFVWLVSPLNLLVTALLAWLLAGNVAGALHLRARPHCRAGGGSAVGGALPALLAGGACCAPSLILLLGVPGLGAFSAVMPWLVPLSIILLAANRVWQSRQGAPGLGLRRGAARGASYDGPARWQGAPK